MSEFTPSFNFFSYVFTFKSDFFKIFINKFGVMLYVKYKLAIIIIIVIILPVPSLAFDNGYARIVYNVRGLQDYDLHWNDRFPPGSIIKIYTEVNGVNHKRAVGVDYIFIIKDSNNNIIDTASYSNRYEDYRENDFVTFSREVLESWEDGVYTAEIHIFDLLNDTLMGNYYDDLKASYLNGTDRPDIPYMNRSEALYIPNQYKEIEKKFYIDRYANKYPPDRFRVENIMLDRAYVAPNVPVQVSANVTNTFYDKGSTSLSLLMDNRLIDSATVEIEGYSSSLVNFTVSTSILGDHRVEIIPTGPNTIGLNLIAVLNVSVEKEIEIPTAFYFKDMQIDRLSVEPNKTVTISVIVENRGKEGSQPVKLYINDVLEEEREIHLNFSEIKDIKFNVTKAYLGVYRVTVAGSNLSKVFFVEEVTPTPTVAVLPIEKKPQLKLIIGLSILIIFIIVLRLYLKRK